MVINVTSGVFLLGEQYTTIGLSPFHTVASAEGVEAATFVVVAQGPPDLSDSKEKEAVDQLRKRHELVYGGAFHGTTYRAFPTISESGKKKPKIGDHILSTTAVQHLQQYQEP